MFLQRLCIAAGLIISALTSAAAHEELNQHPWSADIFSRAKTENRFVILDLEAVQCHWCHVMEKTTYRDPKVVALLKSNYLTVRVDQDANPDISNRYGDWGWPATIVFASDGTEIVKRRGYIPPEQMESLLAAIIADPSPGPSVVAEPEIIPSTTPLLSKQQRDDLMARSKDAFDAKHGGWGRIHKFIDAESMDWELLLAERGDDAAAARARQTFDAALNLIDREWGGIYQYSDELDWKSPHYEKIISFQSSGLRQYSAAYARWRDPKYLEAARDLQRYLLTWLRSPDGAFFTSHNADLGETLHGKEFYALSDAKRRQLCQQPRIDKNIYARENGWAISGLAAYHAATGDATALAAAETAARWILANRRIEGGGFRHGDKDRGGPYLGDTLAMGQAALDLYAATGEREWLEVADAAGNFIDAHFRDAAGGFLTTAEPEGTTGVFLKPVKPLEEQVEATRFANRLYRYLGSDRFRGLAEHGGVI